MKKSILGIIILALNFGMISAYGEFNLEKIDLEITNVDIEPIKLTGQHTTELLKIGLNFTNNGGEIYSLNNKHSILLLYTDLNTKSEDVMKNSDLIKEYYESITVENLKVKYDEIRQLGTECEDLDVKVLPQETKDTIVCFEIIRYNTTPTQKRIERDQFYFKLDATTLRSTCPNCKIISLHNVVASSQPEQELSKVLIPEWVRNNAGWWAEKKISDTDFASGIEFMIKQEIISVPPSENVISSTDAEIPSWVRNNAEWWSKGQIRDNDFALGIQFLISNGNIIV